MLYLCEDSFRFYTSSAPMINTFFAHEFFARFLFIPVKFIVDFYDPVGLWFMTLRSQRATLTVLCLITFQYGYISQIGLTFPLTCIFHRLSQRAYVVILFPIVVKVLPPLAAESRLLLTAVFCAETERALPSRRQERTYRVFMFYCILVWLDSKDVYKRQLLWWWR